MSAPPRGRGSPRPLYVAPPQRAGASTGKGSLISPIHVDGHASSSQTNSPHALGVISTVTSCGSPVQIPHGQLSGDQTHQHGIAGRRPSKTIPVQSVPHVESLAAAAPSNLHSSAAAFSVKQTQLPVPSVKATRKGSTNKPLSSRSTSASIRVADIGPADTGAAVSTPTENANTIVSACMCVSSAFSSNADKALALKELDSSIRSSSLAALIPFFPSDIIPSLAISLPPLVFSGSAGIRALALAVSDGLGNLSCPGWNPDVFLLTCFRFLDASESSNLQFLVQCLCFLISKCSSSWIEPNLSPCMLHTHQLVDNLDNPQKLLHAIRIFSVTATKYPAMFRRHMKSVLKMLLGWCLDASIGLDASLEICHTITDFGSVLLLEPDLIQAAIKKIEVDLERSCVLRSVDFRVPVLTQLFCKLHECGRGLISTPECSKRFSAVLSSLSLCMEKCGIVGQRSICSSLTSLWRNTSLNQSKKFARTFALWLLCWEDETTEIKEDQLSFIVDGCFEFDASETSKTFLADREPTFPTISFFLNPQQLSRTQRFFSSDSVWLQLCSHDGKVGRLMRTLLLHIADAHVSSSPNQRLQFLQSFVELVDVGNDHGRSQSRVASLQALLFPSNAFSASPSALLIDLLSSPPVYARMSFLLLNNIINAMPAFNVLQSSEIFSSGSDSFQDVHASISLSILLRESEMHQDREIHRVVSDTLSLLVYTVAATHASAHNSAASDEVTSVVLCLLQNVDDHLTSLATIEVINSADRRLSEDEMMDALSQHNLSNYVRNRLSMPQCLDRFYAKSFDHLMAAALLLVLEHPLCFRMSIGSVDAILLLLFQCCEGFEAITATAVSKYLLYIGISHSVGVYTKTSNHVEIVSRGSKFALLRRVFAAVGNMGTINGEGCSNISSFISEPTPVTLLSCMWTLSSFSFCDLSPNESAVIFCDALMYASFSFDVKHTNRFSHIVERTNAECSIESHGILPLSSDQLKIFMTFLSRSPEISSSSSSRRVDETVSKIPCMLHSFSRNPSPREISIDVSSFVDTVDILSFRAASAIVNGRFRGGWGGAKEFFDWLASVSQCRGDQLPHNLQQQLVSSLICAIQRLSCAASKPVFSPQGVPLDSNNFYFSQNYRSIENHCHRARAGIFGQRQPLSPYEFHEHFKERLKIIVRSASAAVDKKNATAATATSTSQFQIASRNSSASSPSSSLSHSETAIQELESLVISAAYCSLRLMSPDFSNCLMFAARSSAARIPGASVSLLAWTQVVSLMCLGSYETAFEASIQQLQFSCSESVRNLLIDCACTCVTRLLNSSLISKLESTLTEEERLNSINFAVASAACSALSSWDTSVGILQSMRARNLDSFDRPSAVSGFSFGLMSCISSSAVSSTSATKDISTLSVAITVSLASSPSNELSVSESAMSDMALLNMIDSRQLPPNFGLFSHRNLWAMTLGQNALLSLHVEQKTSPIVATLKFVKTLRKHSCFTSAISFMENMKLLVSTRPEFLIEHFRCIIAVGGSMTTSALTSMVSLSSDLRVHQLELSTKAALCACHHLLSCDRVTLLECSKLYRQEPCILLSDSVRLSAYISHPQKFLLNAIAVRIADLDSTFDNPLPNSIDSTRSICKYLSKLWFLLGSAAFRITSSMFHSTGNANNQDDEHLLIFTGPQMPDFLKLSDREIMAAAIYAQNIWIEQVGKRYYHAIQPRSASEVESCLRLVADKSERGDVLSHTSLDIIFCCWKKIYSHQQQLSSLATKAFLACLRCNVAKESTQLDVVLRLLRIIGCYSAGLDHVLQDGLSTSPSACWVRALPQLVAQLSHVSDRIASFAGSLLSSIARDYPNRVLYTAVCSVGLDTVDPVTSSREWRVVLKELEKLQPHSVSSIRKMASELLLLSVLPEEKLLASIAEIVSQLPVKFQQYTKEVERVTSVGNATHDMQTQRYLTVFRPLLISLDTALQTFVVDCSNTVSILTSHQVWLKDNILPSLRNAVENASTPVILSDISDKWKPLRIVGQKVQELIRRRASIDLVSMSTVLSGDFFACNRLPMPPTTSDASGNYCDSIIAGIEPCILVMRTKTLPKKIVFQSSVGDSKTFLLKGREDLNLDERMMQFVDVANMFFKDTLPFHSRDCVKARKYCVTPLSKRAGLIEWINNCSSLMQLYEAGVSVRASAEVEAVASSSEQKQQSDARHSAPFKPVDHYNQQLQKSLADIGINFKSVPRNQWPREVMLKLYRQMAESAPRSVFHDALWSSSTSSLQWWTRHVTFSRSLAVSSIIGYIIGLGDRHLDNILLDLRDGSVLHIDWNVCFEKGLRLAVPETVPFRLTPGLQYALGPGGAEGVFSNVATQCMEVLRDKRDILMTLLETFVHDPLLDWATALRTRRKRNALEVCVNFSLLATRLEELLDAAQIKESPVVVIDTSQGVVAQVAVIGDSQRCLKQFGDSQLDLSFARYVVSATATEVCLRQCRFLALKNLAGSYSARLAPEKSKATARLCRQDFMRLVIAEEVKLAAFSEFLTSLQQPSTTLLMDKCSNLSKPLFSANPPSQSSWRQKKSNDSVKPLTESEWNRLVGLAHQSFSNLDSAMKELRDFLLKYIDILSPFSPAAYASMTFAGEWSRLGRAVVCDQDDLDGRSAIMVFSSFTCNALLQTRTEVIKCLEAFHLQTKLASEQLSHHSKSLERASDLQECVAMPRHEVLRLFNSLQEVIETHPFEASSTTVGFLKQSIIKSCQNIPSLSESSFDPNVGRCEWFCVVQKLYVPMILTWLVVDSNSALAYLHNQTSMPLPYPCCTFCYELQQSSLSEVIRDHALCDAALLLCKAWNIFSSSWLCIFSLSSQLAHQFSMQALAVPEIESVAAAIAVYAQSEISHDSWLLFIRTQSENAIASLHILQTVSAIYGWCTPLIDWFLGMHQPECLRSWLICLVDVLSYMFSHVGADAFVMRSRFVEKAFHTWSLNWIRLLFNDHNLVGRLPSLLAGDMCSEDQCSDVCVAIAADLNHRVNVSYASMYQNKMVDLENNMKQQQQLFERFLWTHAPIIQLKDMAYCPAYLKDVEYRLPLSVQNVQACLVSFLGAHMNITSREDSVAHSHCGKQPEVVQRRAAVDKIKGNVTTLLDLGKRVIELEQQRCHSHISLNWFGTSAGTVPLTVNQFLNALANWEAASVFTIGGVVKVQEACDVTSRALAVSEAAAAHATSGLTVSEEAAARDEDIKSALLRAEPILSSMLRLLAHPAVELLLPSDIAANLKQIIHEIVERDLRGDGVNSVLKKLCHAQQVVSQVAASLHDKDEVDEVQPSNEGASLAVKALRRIQKKLSGRDTVDAGLNAKAQVERAIDSATNVHLLARMYEGWTPWI